MFERLGTSAIVVIAVLLSAPAKVEAQAVCSAPHSAPNISASGSLTTLSPGHGWFLATLHRVRSNEFYGSNGSSRPFLGGSESITNSAFLTAAIGLTWGVELWAQVPIHALRFDDPTGRRQRTALGDPRVSLRIGSELFTDARWPVSVRAGIKFAGTDFPVDAQVIPLSEGQTDYELVLESGWSFQGIPLYVVGWAGYRWRTEDRSTGREPGDERFAHISVGRAWGSVRLELGLEVLDGLAPVQNRVSIPASARHLVQLSPTIGWSVGPGSLEFGGQIPLSGRNLPTGPGLGLGYLLTWGSL